MPPLPPPRFETSRALGRPSFLRRALAAALGLPFFAYLLLLRRTTTVRTPAGEGFSRPGKTLFVAWHAQAFCAVRYTSEPQWRSVFILGHQKLASLLQTTASHWIGASIFTYLRSPKESGSTQVLEFFASHGEKLVVAVDSGGPYGRVKPGSLRVAREAGAAVVPIAFRCSDAWRIGRKMQHWVPKRGAVFEVRFGEPLELSQDAGRDAASCQEALERLNTGWGAAGG